MNQTFATAGAGGASTALAIVLVWLLAQFHVTMPTEVAMSFTMILMPFVHAGMQKIGITDVVATPAAPAAPDPAVKP